MIQNAMAGIVVEGVALFRIVAGNTNRAAVAVNAFTTCAVSFDLDLPAQPNAIAEVRV
jgi:hypothetical protein